MVEMRRDGVWTRRCSEWKRRLGTVERHGGPRAHGEQEAVVNDTRDGDHLHEHLRVRLGSGWLDHSLELSLFENVGEDLCLGSKGLLSLI